MELAMRISTISEDDIKRINAGDEKAFSSLYEAYYVYLNSIAIYYVIDTNIGGEIVDDVFINIWNKKITLSYPVHSFLIRSVQNGCLNYIRNSQVRQRLYEEHHEQILAFQERHIQSTPVPLEYVETQELEQQIREAISKLPIQAKAVFEAYFFSGKSTNEIAEEMHLHANTVRVHLRKAAEKLRVSLKHLLMLF